MLAKAEVGIANSEPATVSDETSTEAGRPASGLANPRSRRLLMAFLLLLFVGAIVVWRHYAARETTDDAQTDGDIYTISARITGHAIKVNAENNDFVKAATVLVELDPRDDEVALDRARGDLANARAAAAGVAVPITSVTTSSQETAAAADVRNAQAAVAAAEEQQQAAEARVTEAEANDVKAQSDVQRYAGLVAKLEISEQQYDYAVAAVKASGNYVKVVQRLPVKIVFDPGQSTQVLRPGMSVEPTVITK